MAYGPLEYYIIGFEGNHFSGEIAPALKQAADSGAIRILDLAFVTKDGSGNITSLEYQDYDSEVARTFGAIDKDADGLFSPQDLDDISSVIENNSSAAMVLVEHVWAAHLTDAIRRANGCLIQHGILTEDEVHSLEHAAV